MDAYALHLAMAALVGASVVAVSAYYMHRKTLTQLLEFAKTVEKDRDDNSDVDSPQATQHLKKRRSHSRRKGNGYGYYRRASASLPDVTAISGGPGGGGGAGIDSEDRRSNGPINVDGIPVGLPRLHTLPEGMPHSDYSPGEWSWTELSLGLYENSRIVVTVLIDRVSYWSTVFMYFNSYKALVCIIYFDILC